MNFIVATSNPGKTKEIKLLLKDLPLRVVSLEDIGFIDEIEENGKTFQENALCKIMPILNKYPDCYILSDDSGLSVDVLNGEPGIYSKRYSIEQTDEKNREKLLHILKNETNRKAHFTCAMCLYSPKTKTIFKVEEYLIGSIAYEEMGDFGFGYDSIFIPSLSKKHLAEFSDEEKNKISHRGKAFRKIKEYLYEDISNC